jgi:diguanylate cyclase (GGDEF)-like protein
MPFAMTGLSALLARDEAPLGGGDRAAGVVWRVTCALAAVLLALAPPTASPAGGAGWAAAAGVVAVGLVWPAALWTGYPAVAQLAVLAWLAGAAGTRAFGELLAVVVVFAAAVQPPRRALGVVLAAVAAGALPLAYGPVSDAAMAETAGRTALWLGLALALAGLARARPGAQEPARVDQLTRLPDRDAFDGALVAEISGARRYQAPLCLVLADVDGFRAINEEHGELCGDECLRDVADALRGTLRQHDACFRRGGDQFAVLMPATARSEADAACERLQVAVALSCRRPEGAPLSVTCAPAQLGGAMTAEDLVLAAEDALVLRRAPRPPERLAQVIQLRPRR